MLSELSLALLIAALRIQESSGSANPQDGDDGLSWGPYQIQQCCVDDVNQYWHTDYTHADARDPVKAKKICRLYLIRWGRHYEQETGRKADQYILARCWNGGPHGWKKRSTVQYGKSVLNIIKKKQETSDGNL